MEQGQVNDALAPQRGGRARSEPHDRWDDLVLPEQGKKLLRSVPAELDARRAGNAAAGSERVRGPKPGLTLLFAGEAGTGKTFAAELLADELGVGIVAVDLLAVSSLDRSEAENEIGRAFAEAEKSRALVVFDRADVLLDAPGQRPRSKRSREALGLSKLVEGSHGYPGAVVFISRISPKLVPSLRDGMYFAVEFPFPWSDGRKQIWRRLLPVDARVSDDDLEYLADSFMDTGATIRACCVAATAAAAKEGVPVGLIHVGGALESEYRGRPKSQRAASALARLREGTAAAPAVDEAPNKPVAVPEKPARSMPAPAPGTLTPSKPTVEPAPGKRTPSKPAAEPAPGELTPSKLGSDPAPQPAEPLPARIQAALGRPAQAPAESPAPPAAAGASSAKPRLVPAQPALAPTERHQASEKPMTRPVGAVPASDRPTVAQPLQAQAFVPVPVPAPRERPVSTGLLVLAVAGILLAAVLGFEIAPSSGGNSKPAPAAALAAAGPVQISYPPTWRRQALPRARTRGLSDGLAVGPAPPARGLLVIGTSRADDANLLSPPLRIALSDKTVASVVKLGGLAFNAYPSASAVGGSLYALPTTAGTVFAICLTAGAPPGFTHSCERALATLRLTSGHILAPGQNATYASAVNRAVTELNAARSKAASQLRLARTGKAQAAAASQLAAAHAAAASTLSHLTSVGPATAANLAVVAALRATASAYTTLGRAATDNDPAAYSKASSAVTQREKSLQSAFAQLGNLGYQVG